jgi:3-phenylpropionate/trans-cinnamate dioxygenase ferredoxin subunit
VSIALGELATFADGAATAVTVANRRLALVRLGDDVYVLSDRCSHEDFALSTGDVDAVDCTIECDRHGAIFDISTGEALSLPATEPVATFGVAIVNGVVYLDEEWS